ncbi:MULTISPECIES: cardiolipin synthase [Bizionia]|uniref:Cardiolipin synthase n=1 Tax=Bizionia algoritergicola TaxID=291187 RepID=A0A5D0R1K0_9FLAO|nr:MULTISPECIES: cardiolipin synthase [Bizionia]OBX23672.1 cardiolipin synthase [Bizionia sp. APA-3]TYB75392.1 cardiolipin synthase [Bizionia algoritergicola]
MNWILLGEIAYIILIILVISRVLYDTRSSTKALSYILFIVFVPFLGMIFYFSVGTNYRKRKLYSKKIVEDEPLRERIRNRMNTYSETISNSGLIARKSERLIEFIRRAGSSPLTANNEVKLLINGDEKFPELLKELDKATAHIHIEYYIYEDDITGNKIADMLIKKVNQGVEVRFMYDDFGSHGLGKTFIKKLQDGGVQTAPFYKIKWYAFANRINYRNHRKIVVIDGIVGFVGGINMSDKYRNDLNTNNHLFWRDTHVMIKGQATAYLQYLFMGDWNFCSTTPFEYSESYFIDSTKQETISNEVVQIAASGPDSLQPVIFYSLLEAISSAKKCIYITSPYFIPDQSLMDALLIAVQGGLDVKIIIPGVSDSKMVNAAASAYYTELLQVGAKIYKYNKGFVHAKTMVVDDDLAIVGSANMDYRSFDLNFEVNAMIYSKNIAAQLTEAFKNDLKDSELMDAQAWLDRPKYIHLWEKMVRLLSPFL